MTQITENVYAVEVPDNTVRAEIYEKESLPVAVMVYIEDKHKLFKPGIPFPIPLPPGSWQFICTTKEATWLQAAGMVEHYRGGFVNYESNSVPKVAAYSTPFLSLNSLLASKGLDTNKNYCLLKKVG